MALPDEPAGTSPYACADLDAVVGSRVAGRVFLVVQKGYQRAVRSIVGVHAAAFHDHSDFTGSSKAINHAFVRVLSGDGDGGLCGGGPAGADAALSAGVHTLCPGPVGVKPQPRDEHSHLRLHLSAITFHLRHLVARSRRAAILEGRVMALPLHFWHQRLRTPQRHGCHTRGGHTRVVGAVGSLLHLFHLGLRGLPRDDTKSEKKYIK